jgi:hypothetical protein
MIASSWLPGLPDWDKYVSLEFHAPGSPGVLTGRDVDGRLRASYRETGLLSVGYRHWRLDGSHSLDQKNAAGKSYDRESKSGCSQIRSNDKNLLNEKWDFLDSPSVNTAGT